MIYNKSKEKEDLVLTILLIFISAHNGVLSFSPITTIIALVYSIYIFNKRNLKHHKFIYAFILIYLFILLIYYWKFGWINFYLSIYILLKFYYAYLTITILKFNFFIQYEKIIYYLALISLPLFFFQIVDYPLAFKVIGYIQNHIEFLNFRNSIYANIFFFTIDGVGAEQRNSGFAWEPKGFANFLILAIIINLVNNKFKLNKKLLVFFIALITTFSTTGYIAVFTILPIFYYVNKRNKLILSLMLLPIFMIILSFIYNLDFMTTKIVNEINSANAQANQIYDTRVFRARSLGRMGSLIVDYHDFLKNPIIGYGLQREERTQSIYTKLVRVNGLSDILATWGLIGISFYLFSIYWGLKKYLDVFGYRGSLILLSVFIVIYFASTLTAHPLWMMINFIHLQDFKRYKNYNLDSVILAKHYKIIKSYQ